MPRYVLSIMYLSLLLLASIVRQGPAHADDHGVQSDVRAGHDEPQKPLQQNTAVEFGAGYFKDYLTDFTGIIASPARWDSSDWLTATVTAGILAGLYENDAKIQKWVVEHRTNTTSEIGDKVTYLGHGKFTIPLLGGMYLYGHYTGSGKMRETVLLSAESFVLTGMFVQVLKYSTGRHRPLTGDPPHTWDGPRLHSSGSYRSFPSGHASSTFAVATVIATEYDSIPVQALAYGVAAITALNRAAHNAHWMSDVAAGSAIGYFTGRAIVTSHRSGSRIGFSPLINDDSRGFLLTYRY